MAEVPKYGIVDAVIGPLFVWKLCNDMHVRFGDEKSPAMHFIFYLIPLLNILTAWQDANKVGEKTNQGAFIVFIMMMVPVIGPFIIGNKLNELGDAPAGGGEAADA